jgi:hypothetical protein
MQLKTTQQLLQSKVNTSMVYCDRSAREWLYLGLDTRTVRK